jgi:hypothetical protein
MTIRIAALLSLMMWLPAPGATAGEARGAASAEPVCDEWFPDFHCDRSGRFEGFHKPIVAPFLFEDPFITTNAVPYFTWHDLPSDSAFDGGSLYAAALQLRVALTDRVALIATKDGYVWNRNDQELLGHSQGFLNIAAGAKVRLWQDAEQERILSGVLRVELPTGSSDQYQGYGNGLIIPSLTGAFRTGPLRWMADFGSQIPISGDKQSSSLFYHLYADVEVCSWIRPFAQVSGLYWIESGGGKLPLNLENGPTITLSDAQAALGTGPFEGADVANLGSTRVDNQSLITGALGFHVPVSDHVTFSVAYERPITRPKYIFEQRVTSALVIEF